MNKNIFTEYQPDLSLRKINAKRYRYQNATINFYDNRGQWCLHLSGWDKNNNCFTSDWFRADTVDEVVNKIDELLAHGWIADSAMRAPRD